MARPKKHIAIFGNLKMKRVYCKQCKGMTLVRENIKLCCDEPNIEKDIQQIKVICEPSNYRKKPGLKEQRKILEIQNNCCLYCHRPFGTPYLRNGKVLFTKLHFDHLAPFSYTQLNKNNFVAACHICNGIKSNKIFETVEEVCHYVKYHIKKKGITFYEDLPDMPEKVSISE